MRVDAEPTPANSTLARFFLATEDDKTRVTVIESGFDALDVDPAARTAALAGNTRGWRLELDALAAYADTTAVER